jgi:hypothetical protein
MPARVKAQTPLPTADGVPAASATLNTPQLEHLVAPIALYPDPVLTDILAAATWPAQVVEAARFLGNPGNAGLQGAALASAGASHGWDQSVQALLDYPPVLQMMDGNLEWTDRLGRAFIAQQADVMNAIQDLRHKAQAAGTLESGPQDSVVNAGDDIAIYPPALQSVYLPAYDPSCVYGPDPACQTMESALGWGDGFLLPYGYLQWGALDWHGRVIRFDRSGHDRYRSASSDGRRSGGGNIWHPHPAALSRPVRTASGLSENIGGVHYGAAALRGFDARPAALQAPPRLNGAGFVRGPGGAAPAHVAAPVPVAHASGGVFHR